MAKVIEQKPSATIFIKKKHISTLLQAGAESNWEKVNKRIFESIQKNEENDKELKAELDKWAAAKTQAENASDISTVDEAKKQMRILGRKREVSKLKNQMLTGSLTDSFNKRWERITKKINNLITHEALAKQKGLTKIHYYEPLVTTTDTNGNAKTIRGGIIEVNNVSSVTTSMTLGMSPSNVNITLENPNHVLYDSDDNLIDNLTEGEKKKINEYSDLFVSTLKTGTGKLIFEPQDTVYVWLSSLEDNEEHQCFQGIINSVDDSYDAATGRYVISIQASDLTKWLGFQAINVNPSLVQAIGELIDPIYRGAETDAKNSNSITTGQWKKGVHSLIWPSDETVSNFSAWPLLIYSEQFAGLDAGDVISLIVTGQAYNTKEASNISEKITTDNISADKKAEATNLAIKNKNQELTGEEAQRFKVLVAELKPTLDRIRQEMIAQNLQLGNFVRASETKNGQLKDKIYEEGTFANTKDAIRQNKDVSFLIMAYDYSHYIPAYNLMFGGDWKLWDSEYRPVLDICYEIAKTLDFEFYCDEQGNLVFSPPQYNLAPKELYNKDEINKLKQDKEEGSLADTNRPILESKANQLNIPYTSTTKDINLTSSIREKSKETYNVLENGWKKCFIIEDEDIISWNFTHSDINVFSHVEVYGETSLVDLNRTASQMVWGAATDFDLWWDYGYKPERLVKPFLKESNACEKYALAYLGRKKGNILTGTITVRGDSRYQLRGVVYVRSRGMLYYVVGVQHNFTYGSDFATTLTLAYGRQPGEKIPNPFDILDVSREEVGFVKPSESE